MRAPPACHVAALLAGHAPLHAAAAEPAPPARAPSRPGQRHSPTRPRATAARAGLPSTAAEACPRADPTRAAAAEVGPPPGPAPTPPALPAREMREVREQENDGTEMSELKR
ncbi:unnamed protein product [Urochloa humidicola]